MWPTTYVLCDRQFCGWLLSLTQAADVLLTAGGGRSPPQFVRIAHPRRSRDARLAVQRCPGAA
eukprot:SAG25_NODE_15006_length_189_cov_174.244444_1_plen_62_part_11